MICCVSGFRTKKKFEGKSYDFELQELVNVVEVDKVLRVLLRTVMRTEEAAELMKAKG